MEEAARKEEPAPILAPIRWEDPRFPPAIEAARKARGVRHA